MCSEYRIHNADVYVRDDTVTVDDLVDVIEGSRVYIPAIYVINKIDQARRGALTGRAPPSSSVRLRAMLGQATCFLRHSYCTNRQRASKKQAGVDRGLRKWCA